MLDTPNQHSAPLLAAGATKRCLIILSGNTAQTNQQLEEVVAMALVLASFEHHMQLALTDSMHYLMHATEHRVHKMLSSLALYDMPPLWLIHDVTDSVSQIKTTQSITEELTAHTKSVAELANLQHQFDAVWMF